MNHDLTTRYALNPAPITYDDASTRALDRATRAAQIDSQPVSLAVRVALVTLIPSILFAGIIGTMSILN